MKRIMQIKNINFSWLAIAYFTVLCVVLLQGYLEYERIKKDAISTTNNFASLIAKKLESDFNQVNNVLKYSEELIYNDILEENIKNLKKDFMVNSLNSLKNNFCVISALNIVDKNGHVVYSSSHSATDNINISDRGHFQLLKNDKTLNTIFSDMITARTTGKESIAMLRALRDKNGDFLGIISAIIDLEYISNTLSSVDTGDYGVALLRNSISSVLISRYPLYDKADFNKPLPDTNPIFQAIKSGEKIGTLEYKASTDSITRIGTFIVLEKYPFYVQVSISEHEYLKIWYRNFTIVAILMAIFTLCCIVVFIMLEQSYTKEQVAIDELTKSRDLFSSGPVLTLEWSPSEQWKILYISNNCENVLGYSQEEMTMTNFHYKDIIHKDDINRVNEFIKYNIDNNINFYEQSYRIKLKEETYRYIYDYSKVIRDKHNKVISIVGYIIDQTTLKEKESLLILEKNKLANIIESTKVGTWEWNIKTGEIICNNRWAEIIGYNINELSPITIETWIKYTHPDDLLESKKMLKKYYNQEIDSYDCEVRMKHENGSWIWVANKGKIISWDEYQKPSIMMGTLSDITHKKQYEYQLEQEVKIKTEKLDALNENLKLIIQEEVEKNRQKDSLLQQQARLASMGEMIGNIAHQWRQPLSAITTAISGLKFKNEFGMMEPYDIIETNDSIIKNADFLSKTIDNFRSFFKKEQIKKKFFVANAILDTISLIKASYENNFIKLEVDLDENISYFGCSNMLSQVVLNILTNAKDAFLTTEIHNKVVSISLKEINDFIEIQIADNAGGISDNIKDKIFEPYFTTKHQSQGTGLGLYMSTQIMHNHFNGVLSVDNVETEHGVGACFVLKFSKTQNLNIIDGEISIG